MTIALFQSIVLLCCQLSTQATVGLYDFGGNITLILILNKTNSE